MFLDLRQLQHLHSFSLGAQLILFLILYYALDHPYSDDLGDRGLLLGLILCFLSFVVITKVASTRARAAGKINDPDRSWEHYTWTVFMRLAIQESANILTLVIMWLTNNRWLVVPFLLGVMIFIQCRPSRQQYKQQYSPGRSDEEQ